MTPSGKPHLLCLLTPFLAQMEKYHNIKLQINQNDGLKYDVTSEQRDLSLYIDTTNKCYCNSLRIIFSCELIYPSELPSSDTDVLGRGK
jgi:hypothetical protein